MKLTKRQKQRLRQTMLLKQLTRLLKKKQKEIEELKTQLLYKVAEFENYRKRTLKERAELILNGGEKFITSILPILDDMERAIDNGAAP